MGMSCKLTQDHSIILYPAKPPFEGLYRQLHRFCHLPLPDRKDTSLKAEVEGQPTQMQRYQAERKKKKRGNVELVSKRLQMYQKISILSEVVKDLASKIQL